MAGEYAGLTRAGPGIALLLLEGEYVAQGWEKRQSRADAELTAQKILKGSDKEIKDNGFDCLMKMVTSMVA